MSVYHIQGEGDSRIVEAETYGTAVALWLAAMKREFGDEEYEGAEPESVALLSDDPVIREEASMQRTAT